MLMAPATLAMLEYMLKTNLHVSCCVDNVNLCKKNTYENTIKVKIK